LKSMRIRNQSFGPNFRRWLVLWSDLGRNRGQTICGHIMTVIEWKQCENRSPKYPIVFTKHFSIIVRVCINSKLLLSHLFFFLNIALYLSKYCNFISLSKNSLVNQRDIEFITNNFYFVFLLYDVTLLYD